MPALLLQRMWCGLPDQVVLELAALADGFGQPLWLHPTAGPCLRRVGWIAIFRCDLAGRHAFRRAGLPDALDRPRRRRRTRAEQFRDRVTLGPRQLRQLLANDRDRLALAQ